MQPHLQKRQKLNGTFDGIPAHPSPTDHQQVMDPLECARKVAAINAMQFQLMPQCFNCFWPPSYSFTNPWTGQNLLQPNYMTPMPSWLPPMPYPLGVTCEGIPINEKTAPMSMGEVSKDKVDCGMSLISELSFATTLDNSCSILSSDTFETLDASIDTEPFTLDANFDLFSSDFDTFLNQLTNCSDEFFESDCEVLKLQVPFLESHVRVPRKRRTPRRNKRKSLSKKRIRAFRRLIL